MTDVLDDRSLVELARGGDKDAFLALYNTYFPRIHDFCFQMVRNRDDAADVTADVFLTAMERLGTLKDPSAFKGWLYSIARNASLDVLRRRKRTTELPSDLPVEVPADRVEADPTAAIEQHELTELVWTAAATSLAPRDYAVFEMTARHDLGPADVAEALGVKTSNAYMIIERTRERVADALSVVVLSRVGRRECAVFDSLVAEFGGERSPRRRKALMRHVRSCEDCTRTRTRFASADALLRGAPSVLPLPGLRGRIAAAIDELWDGRRVEPPRVRRPALVAAAGGVAVVIALVIGLVAGGEDEQSPVRPSRERVPVARVVSSSKPAADAHEPSAASSAPSVATPSTFVDDETPQPARTTEPEPTAEPLATAAPTVEPASTPPPTSTAAPTESLFPGPD